MPPTSEQLPLLGIYYAITICIVSFSTAMTVVTLNINNKGLRGQEVPKLAKIIFFKYIARYMFINLESISAKNQLNGKKHTIVNSTTNSNSINKENECEDIPLKLEKENNNGSLKINSHHICHHHKLTNTDNFNLDSKLTINIILLTFIVPKITHI